MIDKLTPTKPILSWSVEDNNLISSNTRERYLTIFNNDKDNQNKLIDVNTEIGGRMHQV